MLAFPTWCLNWYCFHIAINFWHLCVFWMYFWNTSEVCWNYICRSTCGIPVLQLRSQITHFFLTLTASTWGSMRCNVTCLSSLLCSRYPRNVPLALCIYNMLWYVHCLVHCILMINANQGEMTLNNFVMVFAKVDEDSNGNLSQCRFKREKKQWATNDL